MARICPALAIWVPLVALLLCAQAPAVGCKADEPSKEAEDEADPPFPQLFDFNEKRIKITSEIIDAELAVGSQTQEEYLDLKADRAAFVLTNKAGYRVKFVDAEEGLAFTYRPYKCHMERIASISDELRILDQLDKEPDGKPIWNYNTHVSVSSGREMRLFGVSALWAEASTQPKSFARAQIIYSAAKNVYRESLLWTYRDERRKLNILFYFIDHKPQAGKGPAEEATTVLADPPTLEMIKIEDAKGEPRLLRTINILSIERSLSDGDDSQASNLLSVPLGFGCFSSLSDDFWSTSSRRRLAEEVAQRRSHASLNGPTDREQLWEGHAELEITATRHEYDQQRGAAARRSSDTYSVELAQASLQNSNLGPAANRVKLVRWRNTREDRKQMLHHTYQVRFDLDMRRGTCEMSHFSVAGQGAGEKLPAAGPTVPIKSKNGLQFDANVDLFTDSEDLHFIKESSGGFDKRGQTVHFYEGTAGSVELRAWLETSESNVPPSRTRVIRAYEVNEYEGTAAANELRSITIWLLNADETRIEQSYQIYVVGLRSLEPAGQWLEKAKLFDVSRECFLENERMLQNRDYAWFTRTYPAPARLLDVIASNQRELKELYYAKAVTDVTRVPRVEIIMEEDAFKIRTLILDLPSLELLYEKSLGSMLEPHYASGDLDFMAPDLAHCAHLCQLNQCTVMSFCESAHTCFLSSRPVSSQTGGPAASAAARLNIIAVKGCDVYKITPRLERAQLHRLGRLVNVISKLQHEDYGPAHAGMPSVPDEVSLPISESRLSAEERRAALLDYVDKINEWLRSNRRSSRSVFVVELAGHFHVLLPSNFELESDPLDQFSLHELTSGGASASELAQLDGGYAGAAGDPKLPVFHRGLAMSRYNPARASSLAKEASARLQFRTMRGLSYDQCALACWDSKCGTFSHCAQARECVLSNINSTAKAHALNLLDQDPDCFVAQRDFLGNFLKFENVLRPETYRSSELMPAGDPSECALNCVARSDFRCLAFDFCRNEGDASGSGRCFYQTERYPAEGSGASSSQNAAKRTGCDHYARSPLADFLRLDARQLEPKVLEQLKTSNFQGLSVFDCAAKCASELVDCTGFQYCHVYGSRGGGGGGGGTTSDSSVSARRALTPARQCTTIESRVTASMLGTGSGGPSGNQSTTGPAPEFSAEDTETLVDERSEGEILHAGKYLVFEPDCQVFTMREDTAEAHLRDLAFGGLVRTTRDKAAGGHQSGLLDLTRGFLFFVAALLVSLSLTLLVMVARDNSELLRQRWERLRLLTGL